MSGYKDCVVKGCVYIAQFNYHGRAPEFCTAHRKVGMTNYRWHICKECPQRAFYGRYKATHCPEHRKEMMRELLDQCDVLGCEFVATYNFPDAKSRRYCAEHAAPGMIPKNRRKCFEPDCGKYACFNFADKVGGRYCRQHAEPEMVNVVRKRCIYTDCREYAKYRYPGTKKPLYCEKHAKPEMEKNYYRKKRKVK